MKETVVVEHEIDAMPDSFFKELLSIKENFADAINSAYFEGRQIVNPDSLIPYPAESTQVVEDEEDFKTMNRINDIAMIGLIAGIVAIIIIEAQLTIDESMCLRVELYKNMHGRLLLKHELELLPVFIFTPYFGSKTWDKTKTYGELVNLTSPPEILIPYFNDVNANIANIKDLPLDYIKVKQYGDFVELIQKFYKGDLNFGDKDYDLLAMKGAAIITNWKDLLEFIYENKEGRQIKMCEAIEKILADKKAEGLEEGKAIGIEEGKIENQEETARKMTQDVRFSEDDILYFTGISKNDILV